MYCLCTFGVTILSAVGTDTPCPHLWRWSRHWDRGSGRQRGQELTVEKAVAWPSVKPAGPKARRCGGTVVEGVAARHGMVADRPATGCLAGGVAAAPLTWCRGRWHRRSGGTWWPQHTQQRRRGWFLPTTGPSLARVLEEGGGRACLGLRGWETGP